METVYKDGFDVVTDVRALINVASIQAMLDGGKVEPSIKSTGASKKGIVVNCPSISNTAEQIGFGSINCYAPAIISTVDNKPVQLPDQATLSNLAKAVKKRVDSYKGNDFECWIESLPVIMQDTDGSYFANLRFRYQASQRNFKNI